MKKIKYVHILWLALVSLLSGNAVKAQAPSTFQASPVYVSRYVDTVAGKVYRVHEVQPGHTLYSISRAYNTAFDKILKDSPDNTVKIGEVLYIPYQKDASAKNNSLLPYTGMKPLVIVAMSGNIPATESESVDDAFEEQNAVVETKEEPVAKAYEEKNAVVEAKGEPVAKADRKQNAAAEAKGEVFTEAVGDTVPTEAADVPLPVLNPKDRQDTLDIALMLPLYSNNPDDRRAYVYLPFFEGAGVAWTEYAETKAADTNPETDKLSETAIRFHLYDLTLSEDALDRILADSEFLQTDAIIAAAFAKQFPALDEYSARHEIPLIHPISERDSMGVRNPYFLQLCASRNTQYEKLVRFAETRYPDARCVIISDSTPNECRKADRLLARMPRASRHIFGDSTDALLKEIAESHRQYLILPFYSKEIWAVRTLLPLRQSNGNVHILAPSAWLEYPTVELDYFLQNNLCIYACFFRTENDSAFKAFARNYTLTYKALPKSLAYQGYLSFGWLLKQLTLYNADFLRHLEEDEETEFIFKPLPRKDLPGFEDMRMFFLKLDETGLREIPFE